MFIFIFIQSEITLCKDIINDTQCASEQELEGGCTWMYKFEDESLTNGICIQKNTEEYECINISRRNQCENGGGVKMLENQCGIYDNACKLLCNLINSNSICDGDDRENDCFWLEGNSTATQEDPDYPVIPKCVNKVYLLFSHLFILLFLLLLLLLLLLLCYFLFIYLFFFFSVCVYIYILCMCACIFLYTCIIISFVQI
jgi:hypothetical protein